jgi:hypothetical protein
MAILRSQARKLRHNARSAIVPIQASITIHEENTIVRVLDEEIEKVIARLRAGSVAVSINKHKNPPDAKDN